MSLFCFKLCFRFFIFSLSLPTTVESLSNTASTGHPSHIVNIVGLPGGQTQSLPTSYAQTFGKWQITEDNELVERPCQEAILGAQIKWTSNLQARPAVEFMIRNGVPTYVMAGIQLRKVVGEGQDKRIVEVGPCPMARQWTTFSLAVEPQFRVEVFEQERENTVAPNGEGSDETSSSTTTETFGSPTAWSFGEDASVQMQEAMQQMAVVTSQVEEGSALLGGFHIISVPLQIQWADVPEPRGESYRVSCLATAEPDAAELLTLEDYLVEMTASAILEFDILAPPDETKEEL